MLADKFQEVVDALEAKAAERQQASAARDAFIATNFPLLDQAFSDMVSAATGSHPRLAVVKTMVTETFTGRGFATLNKTVIDVRSTLYGPIELLRFTPALESVDVDQFGVIRIESQGLQVNLTGDDTELSSSMLQRGILMRGTESADLVVSKTNGFETLTADLLEELLAAVFIRTT